MPKKVEELSGSEKEGAAELHKKATVVNMLTGCHGWQSPWREHGRKKAYNLIQMGLRGGCSANSLTLGGESIGQATLSISLWDDLMANIPDKAVKILSAEDIVKAKNQGKSGYIINFQNTTALEGRVSAIDLFHKLGLRVMQLTYQRAELVGDGCGSKRASTAGLTDLGVAVVERMNRLRMVLDLSHVGYATAMETIEVSKLPPAFTHTNCAALFKFMRNKSDDALKALAEKGGVVGMTAIARFIREEGDLQGSTIEHFLDHIEYAVNLIGADHVGIGLDINEGITAEDYYGVQNENYEARFQADATSHVRRKHPFEHYYVFGLDSISKVGHVTEGLVARGYSDREILGILGGNWLRYLRTVLGK